MGSSHLISKIEPLTRDVKTFTNFHDPSQKQYRYYICRALSQVWLFFLSACYFMNGSDFKCKAQTGNIFGRRCKTTACIEFIYKVKKGYRKQKIQFTSILKVIFADLAINKDLHCIFLRTICWEYINCFRPCSSKWLVWWSLVVSFWVHKVPLFSPRS